MNPFKKIATTFVLLSMCLSLTACPFQRQKKLKFDSVKRSTFEDAMEVMNIEYESIDEYLLTDAAYFEHYLGEGVSGGVLGELNGVLFAYVEYCDTYFAHEFFKETFSNYDSLYNNDHNREINLLIEDDTGYVIFDFDYKGTQVYGGFYFKDNVIIIVSNDQTEHKYSDEALIDSFLDKIGYPKP